jgi:hypothetical protein
MTDIAYITDVEGRWDKLASFAQDNPLVRLEGERIELRDGATLVFGGDAVDRGPDARKLVRALLDAKRRHPSRVILLAGNRDINKLRLARELRGFAPHRTPDALRAQGGPALLRWIFSNTMGARDAFAHRQSELSREAGRDVTDDEVFESFVEDVSPRGAIRAYLRECTLGFRAGDALFLHGGVTEENFGVAPTGALDASGRAAEVSRVTDAVDPWIQALDRFYREQIARFEEGADAPPTRESPPWSALVCYQAPLPDSRLNQRSVVYARPSDAHGNPSLPPSSVLRALRASGVRRVFVGHTPSGDCPSVLRDGDFSLVLADNSYGRVEPGSRVIVEQDVTTVSGLVLLDGESSPTRVHTTWTHDTPPPLGARTRDGLRLVKGRTERGDFLLFRGLGDYQVEQRLAADGALSASDVEPAY